MLDLKLQPLTKSVLQLLLLAICGYALFLIQGILVYGIIALYISVLGRPIISGLGMLPKVGHKLNPTVKASITILILGAIVFGIATWFFPVVIREFSFIGTIEYDALLMSLQDEWSQLDVLLTSFGIDSQAELTHINETLQEFASIEAISGALGSVVGGMGQFIVG